MFVAQSSAARFDGLDLVSTAQPAESGGFKGDGKLTVWRRGGSPASLSDVEWLCSESCGPGRGG